MLSRIFILIFLTSCSLFKGADKISSTETKEIISSVKLIGEGRGRLHISQQQYLFSIESVLNEQMNWILAVTIPLHGEEALIFPGLRKEQQADAYLESFAQRINIGIKENLKTSKLSGKEFLLALRKTVRLILAKELGLNPECTDTSCRLEKTDFSIERSDKSFRIIYKFPGHELITTASNLTDSFFLRTQFKVVSAANKNELLSLELFWNE